MNNPMRISIWLASLIVFLVTLAVSSAWLPERVATHFSFAGQADRWMSRSGHLTMFGTFGVLFSSFFVGLFYSIRFLPPSLLNVSNPEYWRSPQHYPDACRFMFQQSFLVATMAALFVTGLNVLIVRANLPKEPEMTPAPVLVLAGLFLLGTAYWVVGLMRFFRHTSRSGQN